MTTQADATTMVQSLVGTGITTSNATFSGAARAGGTFTGGDGIIGFSDGVVLSTGDIALVTGPNSASNASGANLTPGDAALSALSNRPTCDAAVLEFSFVPAGTLVSFEYVFSSEEYNEYVGNVYNDVFGFFVNGQNCATLQGGEPVAINTVNLGSYSSLFRDNALGTIDTQMDGLTVVLSCTAPVTPNEVNHMRLAIADASDHVYDSDVFIKSSSLEVVTELGLKKTADLAEANPGDVITYTYSLENNGNVPLSGITLADDKIASLPGCPATTTLAVGGTTSCTAAYTVSAADGQAGQVTNIATADSVETEPETAELTVPVIVPNEPPVANEDAATTAKNTAVLVDVLANDTDGDGDTLAIASFTQPSFTQPSDGAVTVGAGGALLYTPSVGFTGVDAFTYVASDGVAVSNEAAVTVVVTNGRPSAADDAGSTFKGISIVLDVLANDTDPDSDLLSVSDVQGPSDGVVTANGDGTVTYAPDSGFAGVDTFTYRADDGDSKSSEALVTVEVVNRAPEAADDVSSTSSNVAVVIPVLANDSDADGDLLTVADVGQPSNGTTSPNPDGTVTYAPSAGFVGVDSFTYRAADGDDQSNLATVTVTIVNTPPSCSAATPSATTLWPPNKRFVAIAIQGVTDADGHAVAITITGIYQDEPVNAKGDGNTTPDGRGVGGATAEVRSERSGKGDGRAYHIVYTATDTAGGSCSGETIVTVPHDQSRPAVDGGAIYDSTR